MNEPLDTKPSRVTNETIQNAVLLSEAKISGQIADMERRLSQKWEVIGGALSALQALASVHTSRLDSLEHRTSQGERELADLARDTSVTINMGERIESLGGRIDGLEKARTDAAGDFKKTVLEWVRQGVFIVVAWAVGHFAK